MTEKSENKLIIYRRRMPHWCLAGAVNFVTWRLRKSQRELAAPEREVIVSTLRHFDGQRYDLLAYAVMPDHVHILVKPLDKHPLSNLVHSWKSYTAYQVQKKHGRYGKIWQEDYFDRIIRNENEFLEKAQYILNNPLKISPQIEEYPWVWVKTDIV